MATAAQTPRVRWRKWLRRGALAAGALLLLMIVGLLLLPVWISNDQGRAYILDRLNARLKGPRVTVDKWSLGWFSPTELTNLKILQPDGNEILSCPRVSSGLTLWDIWRGNYDGRNTTADQLELRILRYPDGSTSLESLFQSAGDVLQSARGALQVRDGSLILTSLKTGIATRYVDVRATITIASRQAPFQIQISAVEETPAGHGIAGNGALSLNGTFPPTASLSADSLRYPGLFSILSNLEFTAMRVPTALVCDFAGVDPAWAESFGDTFESIQITAHPTAAQDGSRLAMTLRGVGPERPEVDALVLMRPASDKSPANAVLSIPAGKDYQIRSALRWSAPLARLLGRLNPMLGEAVAGPVPSPAATSPASRPALASAGLVRGNIMTMNVPLDHVDAAEATGRITFPPLIFVSRDGPSMVRQMQVITGELPAARPGPAPQGVEGAAGLLRLALVDRRFAYENFSVRLGRSRLDFSGSVGVDGQLALTALIPEPGNGLSAGSSRVSISGTIESPLVKSPQ